MDLKTDQLENDTFIVGNVSCENISGIFGNTSSESSFINPFNDSLTRISFIICYAAVFAMCVIGNTIVLLAIASSPRLRSMTNFFLANLAVADFCVGVFCVLPNLSLFLSQNWILGRAMCKIYYYVWNVSYMASIVILTTIAVERYIAIIYPLKAKHFRTRKKLVITCVIIWTIAVLYNTPYLFYYDTVAIPYLDIEFCYFNKTGAFGLKCLSLANFIVWYLLPLTVIGVLYTRVGVSLWKIPISVPLHPRSCSSYTGSQRSLHSIEESHTLSVSSAEHEIHSNNGKCYSESGSHLESESDSQKATQTPIHNLASHLARNLRNSVTNRLRNTNSNKPSETSSLKVNVGRRKVIRLLIAVVVSFAVCVLPHHLKVINYFWDFVSFPHNVEVYFSPVAFIVLYLNNCLNPILYALFSTNFRRAFSESMIRSCSRHKKQLVSGKCSMMMSVLRR